MVSAKIRTVGVAAAIVLASTMLLAAQLVSDPFTGAAATGLGANWTDVVNGLDLTGSGTAITRNASTVFNSAVYTGGSWPSCVDQYAEVEIRQQGASSDGGPLVRGATGANTGYNFNIGDSSTQAVPGTLDLVILKIVAGSFSEPSGTGQHSTASIAVGDVLRLEATGTTTTTLVAKINGVTKITVTDSSSPLTTGNPGIWTFQHGFDSANKTTYDNFAAGDFGGCGGSAAPALRRLLLGVGVN